MDAGVGVKMSREWGEVQKSGVCNMDDCFLELTFSRALGFLAVRTLST